MAIKLILRDIMPEYISASLAEGICEMGRKIKGFDRADAVLTGIESRTSSPVRILRGEDYTALGYSNIYPCGEGAGYAGGITSAAVDGINCAMHIMAKYRAKI